MIQRISIFICLFMILTGASLPSFASVENAKRVRLDNGLEVILAENHSSPIVSANVFIRAGVSTETPQIHGASHFLEHLLFNGTERRSQKELYDEVDFLGAYNNAFTREDYTCFQMIISSSLLEKGLDIQSDMLLHSTLPEDKFEKEKKIVIEEIGKDMGNPDYVAELFFVEKAFEGTPYAKPVLGTTNSITEMKQGDVLRYYKQYYVPNNMVLFLVGDFKPEEALRSIQKYFGSTPRSKLSKAAETRFSLKREKNLFRSTIETGRDYLEIVMKAPEMNSPDFVPFQILVSILSDGEDSRLSRSLTGREIPLVLDFSLNHSIYGGQGILRFSATVPQKASSEKVAEVFFRELQRIVADRISPDEVEEAKKNLKSSEIYQEEQFHYYSVMRGQRIAFAPAGFLENYLSSLESQDLNAVSAVAKKYLKELSPIMTVSGAKQADGAAEQYSVGTYEPEKALVVSDDMKKEILENGLTVIARKDGSAKIFALHLLMKNRSLNEPDGKAGIADFGHRMLLNGTALMDSADISEALKEIGAKVKFVDDPFIPYDDYYTTPLYSYIRFEILSEDYRKGLKLLKEVVFHPSFPADEIQKVATEMIDIIRKNEEKASTRAKNLFYSKVFEGSKLGNSVYGNSDAIRSITRDDLLAFHRDYFSPRNVIVSIVSDIQPDEVIKQIKGIFGSLRPSEGQLAAMPQMQPTVKNDKFETKGGKEQSYLYVGYLFHPAEEDIPALTAANAILSDRMALDLREEQGLAYSIGSSLSNYGDSLLFMASMGTRPENIENAISGIYKEIDIFADSELAERELQKTINSLIGRNVMRRISGINRAYFIGLSEFQGKGQDLDLDLMNRMKNVTADMVKKAAKKYFRISDVALVVAK